MSDNSTRSTLGAPWLGEPDRTNHPRRVWQAGSRDRHVCSCADQGRL